MTGLEAALLPCPFCGGAPKVETAKWGTTFSIACRNTKCFGPSTPYYGNEPDAIAAWNRRSTIGGEPVATQYRYWYSSGEPGVWLNERRKDADDLLESGVLIREETRALYLGDSEAGAESSLRNVQTTTSGLSPFAGWQNYQHQRAACAAVFRDGWSMEDENTLIDLVTRTWPCPSPAKTSTGE